MSSFSAMNCHGEHAQPEAEMSLVEQTLTLMAFKRIKPWESSAAVGDGDYKRIKLTCQISLKKRKSNNNQVL
jgi:hypothetical protein